MMKRILLIASLLCTGAQANFGEWWPEAITALREALAEQKSGIKQVIELYDSPDQPAQQEPGRNHYEDGDVFERIAAMKKQPSQQEPVAFEEWLAKQHGDPEDIGFLQALRIAYIAGQDSITSPPAQRKPLTDSEIIEMRKMLKPAAGQLFNSLTFARAIEAAHGIKENT